MLKRPSSLSPSMVCRTRVVERRMLASVSISASEVGTNLSVSAVNELAESLCDSFFDCTITSAVISKLCFNNRGSSRTTAEKIRKNRLIKRLLAKKMRMNSCR